MTPGYAQHSQKKCKINTDGYADTSDATSAEIGLSKVGEEGVDMLVSDHFNKPNLNNGFFFARATDNCLRWWLHFVSYLHANPFAHDGDAFDSLLSHSLQKPYHQDVKNPPLRYR